MAIIPTYPGIYIQELPSGAHTIVAAPTSITVFVGYVNPFKTPAANFKAPVEIFGFTDFEANFGGFYLSKAIDSNVAHAVNEFFLNGGSVAYVVGLNPAVYSDSDGSNQTAGSNLGLVGAASSVLSGIAFTALEPADLQNISVVINNVQTTTNPNDTADITLAYGTQTETYRRVLISATDLTVLNHRINGVSVLVTVAPSPGPNYPAGFTAGNVTLSTTLPGGTVGVFNASDFEAVFAADSLLDKLPIFNLMLMPGIVNNGVLSQAIAFCERKQAFLIMDPPRDDQADQVPLKNWIGDFVQAGDLEGNIAPLSQNSALYFPYLKTTDPLSGLPLNLPPSGYVAGVYASTDLGRGVWKAPAGMATVLLDTTGVVDSGRMTDNRQGVLNPLAVNCIRSFPTGTVVFGARTLVGQDTNTAFQQWKYVPVRRMALFIEQSLYQSLKWVIFEPNDDPLWVSIRTTVENFMMTLFNQGAFAGSAPSTAFKVLCDSTTTTPTDVSNGIVNIIVAFAPLKPAEFVIIKIAQLAGQVQQ
jgi:phage tail sheath protein FI